MHSHLSHYPNTITATDDGTDPETVTIEQGAASWIEHMQEAGISRTITFDFDNGKTARFLEQHSRHFSGMVIVDPRFFDRASAVIERYVGEDRRFVGVKCSPSGDYSYDGAGWDLDDRRSWPFFEFLAARRLPILFHTGIIFRDPQDPSMHSVSNARPLLLDGVARAFPDLPIIVGHAGRPLWQETLCLANLPNVHIDLTWSQLPIGLYEQSVEMAITGFGADRVMFGSDTTPWIPSRCALLAHETVRLLERLQVGEDAIGQVMGGNARRLFGL